jgi:hypothetical protein
MTIHLSPLEKALLISLHEKAKGYGPTYLLKASEVVPGTGVATREQYDKCVAFLKHFNLVGTGWIQVGEKEVDGLYLTPDGENWCRGNLPGLADPDRTHEMGGSQGRSAS